MNADGLAVSFTRRREVAGPSPALVTRFNLNANFEARPVDLGNHSTHTKEKYGKHQKVPDDSLSS